MIDEGFFGACSIRLLIIVGFNVKVFAVQTGKAVPADTTLLEILEETDTMISTKEVPRFTAETFVTDAGRGIFTTLARIQELVVVGLRTITVVFDHLSHRLIITLSRHTCLNTFPTVIAHGIAAGRERRFFVGIQRCFKLTMRTRPSIRTCALGPILVRCLQAGTMVDAKGEISEGRIPVPLVVLRSRAEGSGLILTGLASKSLI